ncbi:DUF4326 domain-containing protein [Streptomyces achromogenes]|uniref:DUF4326 domain-containing protein n=1 Tax=Streptomyces achromogenes TaxID=67255 RepID=UPI0036FBEFB7
MSPARIQRRRTKGWRAEDHTTNPLGVTYVGRGTRWGNPARRIYAPHGLIVQWGTNGAIVGTWPTDGVEARRFATDLYRSWINQPEQEHLRHLAREQLAGVDLLCWCPLPEPGQPDHCHAAVLLEIANRETP